MQRLVIEMGLQGWSRFSKADRLFTLEMISRSMEHIEKGHSKKVLELVRSYGFLEVVCLLNKKNARVNKYCKKYNNK